MIVPEMWIVSWGIATIWLWTLEPTVNWHLPQEAVLGALVLYSLSKKMDTSKPSEEIAQGMIIRMGLYPMVVWFMSITLRFIS